MNLSEDQLKLAEDYLDGLLSQEANTNFETQFSTNPELREYIAINKEMRAQYNEQDWSFVEDSNTNQTKELENYFKSKNASELKTVLKKVNSDFQSKSKTTKSKKLPFIGLAASIALLIGFFIFNSSESSLELYEDYNNWEELPSLINRGEAGDSILAKAEMAFLNKDYNEAYTLFESYIENTNAYNPNAELYFGITQLELNNFKGALNTFDKLLNSKSLDSSKAYWYKTLIYLKMDVEVNAVKQLETITSNSENFNFNKAKLLLEKLK